MSTTTLPTSPVEGWEAIRDEWVADVNVVLRQAEEWATRKGWHAVFQPKTIDESKLGTYTVPQLWVFADRGRLLLEPVARFVGGAEGLIDFQSVPEFRNYLLARMPDGWVVFREHSEGERIPWTAESFVQLAAELDTRR